MAIVHDPTVLQAPEITEAVMAAVHLVTGKELLDEIDELGVATDGLPDGEVTFLLTSGGHNAGIVTPPGHPRRIYQISRSGEHEHYQDPERWQLQTPVHQGSWWPEYQSWLAEHSGQQGTPPPMGTENGDYPALCDAPGEYIHQT